MNTKKYLTAVVIALATISYTACNSGNTDDMNFEIYNDSARYVLQNSAEAFMADSDVVYETSVQLVMPQQLGQADLTELRDSILSFAFGKPSGDIAADVKQWSDSCAAETGFTPKAIVGPRTAYPEGYNAVQGFVVYLKPSLLVYCVRNDYYTPGAAHGYTSRRYINFRTTNKGEILTLNDLFTPEGLAALPKRIAEQAKGLQALIGDTDVDALPENGNFYISSESEIVFAYQPYEIASYAQGTIDIPFFPYELSEYMTPQAITMFHLEDLAD